MLHFFPEKLTFELVTIAFCLLVLVEGRPVPSANNITIVGANNNDPNVHCQPTTWYDICWFIFANYILHALSVRSLPGENAYSSLVFKTGCLLIPYTGLRRGLCLISRASNCVGNELQGAARASALCMVIRSSDWRPYPGDEVEGCEVDLQRELAVGKVKADPEKRSGDGTEVEASSRSGTGNAKGLRIKLKDLYTAPPRHGIIDRITGWVVETHRFQISTPSASIVDHKSVNIHGRCELSPGYGLSYIPGDMKVYPRTISNVSTRSASETRVACVQGFPRILFSLTQTVSGAYSLYKARGSQINRYGFAAFGLTVIPYIVISLVNLLGSLLTSQYETIFLVHSSIMDEMVARGGVSDGAVGTIHAVGEEHPPLLARAENTAASGISLRFEGTEDSLRCFDPTNVSFEVEPRAAKRDPVKRKVFRFWPDWFPTRTRKCEATEQHDTIVSIPSHPPFSRIPPLRHQVFLNFLSIVLLIIAFAIPYLIIGILSGFKPNQATGMQRSFTLTWLICGQAQGYIVGDVEKLTGKKSALKGLFFIVFCYGSYCLCGFFVVAQEMIQFGNCKAG